MMRAFATTQQWAQRIVPEQKLWARVLELAVRDACAGDRQAEVWLLKKDTAEFSALWVAEQIGIDHGVLTLIVQHYKKASEEERERIRKDLI